MGATVPNLSAKKGKNKKRKAGYSKLDMQDMHNILNIAFSLLREAYNKGGIVWKGRDGKTKILKPYIHMVMPCISQQEKYRFLDFHRHSLPNSPHA